MRAPLVFAVAGLVAAGACDRSSEPPPPPNVILISLDTVRRDAVGVYRQTGPSPTPEIDRFAESCVSFEHAWAPIPFTLSSHMSMFTGLNPATHGVMTQDQVLDAGIPTVSEIAAAGGYRSIGLVSNIWMKGHFGFDRGFDHYERISFGLTYAERINARFFDLLDRVDAGDQRPLFAFLHYIDAHSDYDKAGSNALPYYAPPEELAALGLSAGSTDFCDDDGNCGTHFLTAANNSGRPIDQALIERIAELYLVGVGVLDHHIGALLSGLEERGLLEDSVVIITSDHGEEFREHGRFVHAQPYVESLAVPLLVRFPGGAHAGTVVEDPVELADLMPSILGAMGLEIPIHVPSRDIFAPVATGSGIAPAAILGVDKNRKQRFALRNHRHTFILDQKTGETELYDRLTDPEERTNLVEADSETAAAMEIELRKTVTRFRLLGKNLGSGEPLEDNDVLSDEEAEQLRAIGYLG